MGLMTMGYREPLSAELETMAAAAAETAAQTAVEYWGRQVSAHTLMDEIAGRLGVDHDLVWQALCDLPDNLLTLLDSPQGWTALLGCVSSQLGIVPPDYKPMVH